MFTLGHLKVLFAEPHPNQLYRSIKALSKHGVISRFVRGIYITATPDLAVLSQRLAPESYGSMTQVLSENLVIGIKPKNVFKAVRIGVSKSFTDGTIQVQQYGVAEKYFFGFDNERGVSTATPEKAWLDTIYLYQHGAAFPFDIYSDVNYSRLNRSKIEEYLVKYRNPKFQKFARSLLNETSDG